MAQKSDHAEPILESTQVKTTADNESEERDDSEKTESEGVEEVDVEDVKFLINIKNKAKNKKRKATTSIQRNNPVRKTSRKSTPSVAETQSPTPPTVAEGSSTRTTRKSVNAELVAEHRYESFSSREIIPERSVDLDTEDTWGFLDIIKKGHLERIVTGLVGVEVIVRDHRFEFSPTKINEYLNLMPLSEEEVKAYEKADALTIDELADFLTEGTLSLRNLITRYLSPCKAALVILSVYNWVPSSHKNVVSADRARLIYKMFHGTRVDVGEMFYSQILNLAVLQKEGGKKDMCWLILPRTIFGVLQTQFEMQKKPREKLSGVIPYKKDSHLGQIYLKNQKEKREAENKAQRQAKKKGKSASTSTAVPPSGPPPSTPRSERTDPSGYVPPRQSPRSTGKFQIIHLGSIAALGQPIDAEEAKLALDTASAAIQQLATAMQTLTSVVGQIASMLYPRGEEEADDPQQKDDQEN
ncbi:hypothetical protein F2Q70_00021036 [Brassica cretica]|uniref:Putative plant transposon protein domain-containing protein n=2 Tax=Brassica cretica TaxID=69181 RepID=A0A3N6U0Y5_BRACR|nr:hypothetical protein F2Q70_00021036 [Brassica cretica]KAF2555414.1 hypothetical protein F2Q68_00014516 [Brassica cretica]KAF3610523.1 hypothetical protein DY000_02047021 [Brassica cretica]